MHAAAFEHETPVSVSEPGSGTACTVQLVPSQRSASGATTPFRYSPTAVHAVAEVHDTASRALSIAPLAGGLAWTAHAPPSHRSIAVGCEWPGVPVAVHAVGEEHETAYSHVLSATPCGLASSDQVVPSQCVARPFSPTATHAVGVVHDTPSRALPLLGSGTLGVDCGLQAVPSQRSASVDHEAPFGAASPT